MSKKKKGGHPPSNQPRIASFFSIHTTPQSHQQSITSLHPHPKESRHVGSSIAPTDPTNLPPTSNSKGVKRSAPSSSSFAGRPTSQSKRSKILPGSSTRVSESQRVDELDKGFQSEESDEEEKDEEEEQGEMEEGEEKNKHTRRSGKDLLNAWETGERKGLSKCDFCLQVYTSANGHGCIAKSFLTHFPEDHPDYQAVQTRCVKQFLPGLLNEAGGRAAFASAFFQSKAIHQHRSKYMASLLLEGSTRHGCRNVTLDNIDEYMVLKERKKKKKKKVTKGAESSVNEPEVKKQQFIVNQTVVKTAISLVCQKPTKAMLKGKTPLHQFYNTHFAPYLSRVRLEYGDGKDIQGTSLQYCARQMRTDFCNMKLAQLWPVTIYWVRKELADLDPRFFRLFPARSMVVKEIMGWMFRCVLGEKVTVADATETGLMAHMRKRLFAKHAAYFEGSVQLKAWKELWTELYSRCLRVLIEVLRPFESGVKVTLSKLASACKSPVSIPSSASLPDAQEYDTPDANESPLLPEYDDNDDEDDDDSATNAKKKAMEYTACRRTEWLCAVQKRLEVLESRAIARFNHDSTSSSKHSKTAQTPPRFKISNVFPLAGWVPGSIMVTEQLLQCLVYEYNCKIYNDAMEVEKKKSPALRQKLIRPLKCNQDPHEWMKFFKASPTFWKSLRVAGDRSSVHLRNKFTTDGICLSILHTSIVTKKKFVPPVLEGGEEDRPLAPKLNYINGLSLDDLRKTNHTVMVTGDLNRKNYAVFHIWRIDLPESYPPSFNNAMEIDDGEERKSEPPSASIDNFRELVTTNPFATLLDKPDYPRSDKENKIQYREDRRNPDIAGCKVVFTKAEYKSCRKIKQHAQLRAKLEATEREARVGRLDIFAVPPSLKSSSQDSFTALLQFLNQPDGPDGCLFGSAMKFYARTIFRRLRMESYSANQKWWVYVQNKIYAAIPKSWGVEPPRKILSHMQLVEEPIDTDTSMSDDHTNTSTLPGPAKRVWKPDPDKPLSPRVLFILGDGSFRHNSSGHLTMPSGHRLFAALTLLGEWVVWVDEFRTSKCCSSCGSEMEQALIMKKQELRFDSEDDDSAPPVSTRPGLQEGERKRKTALHLKLLTKRKKQLEEIEVLCNKAHAPAIVLRRRTRLLATLESIAIEKPTLPRLPTPKETDEDFAPAYPFQSQFERFASHRHSPQIEDGERLVRSLKGVPSGLASAHERKTLLRPWGLRHCSDCDRLWCRDDTACRAMRSRSMWLLTQPVNPTLLYSPHPSGSARVERVLRPHKTDGPAYLRRQTRVPKDGSLSLLPSKETAGSMNPPSQSYFTAKQVSVENIVSTISYDFQSRILTFIFFIAYFFLCVILRTTTVIG